MQISFRPRCSGLVKGLPALLIGRAALAAEAFLVLIIASRSMSRAQFGVYVILITGYQIALVISQTAVSSHCVRFPSSLSGTSDTLNGRRSLIIIANFLVGPIAIATAAGISDVTGTSAALLGSAALCAAVHGWAELLMTEQIASAKMGRFIRLGVAAAAGGVLGALIGSRMENPILGVLVMVPLGHSFGVLAVARLLRLPSRVGRPTLSLFRQVYGYGLGTASVASALFLLASADRIIVARWLGPIAAGAYTANYLLADQTVQLLLGIVLQARLAEMSRLYDAGSTISVKVFRDNTVRLVAFGGTLFLVATVLLGPLVLPKALRQPALPAVLLLVGLSAVVFKVGEAYASDHLMRLAPFRLAGLIAVAAAVNISLNIVLIPRYGLTGSAVANIVAASAFLAATVSSVADVPVWPLPNGLRAVALLIGLAIGSSLLSMRLLEVSPLISGFGGAVALLLGLVVLVRFGSRSPIAGTIA